MSDQVGQPDSLEEVALPEEADSLLSVGFPDKGDFPMWPSPDDRQRNWRGTALMMAVQVYERMGPVKRRYTTQEESRDDFVKAQGAAVEELFQRFYRLLDPNGDGS